MELTFPTLKKLHQTLSNIEKIDRKRKNLSAPNRTTMPKKLQHWSFKRGIEDLGSVYTKFDLFSSLLPGFGCFVIFMQDKFLRLLQEKQKKSSNRTSEICGQKKKRTPKNEVRVLVQRHTGGTSKYLWMPIKSEYPNGIIDAFTAVRIHSAWE